jgi:hypothetical protein
MHHFVAQTGADSILPKVRRSNLAVKKFTGFFK